ncbi:MAG: Wzz/FepE/Etk N-terminal domain-containing protein [Pseudomonadota bacterium]
MSTTTGLHDGDFGGLDAAQGQEADGLSLGELVAAWRSRLKLLLLAPLAVGAIAVGITYLIAPTFTATTTFLPPAQSQNNAAAALASLGALGSLAGNVAGTSNAGDRYLALLLTVNVSDRLIDKFKLMEVYETEFKVDARRQLLSNVRVALGKKDGLITVDVDDSSAQRAADMANQYVEELRRVTSTLAVTEAQQRRVFFEAQLQETQVKLVQAQQALQSSGFNQGALKAEPKAAAESYARLKAEATATEVRLQTLRSALSDNTPEVQQQLSMLAALRAQLASAERSTSASGDADYIGRYRNYKYQETLFELYARQFELARVDESREGALFQVVDRATPPERRAKPKRAMTGIVVTVVVFLLLAALVAAQAALRHGRRAPAPGAAGTAA